MLKSAACAVITCAALSTASAQESCATTYRELARPTPRLHLLEASDSGDAAYKLARTGSGCAWTSVPAMASRTLGIGKVHGTVRLLAPSARLDFIGGLPSVSATGGAWVGRGSNAFVRLAASLDAGRFHAILAPEIWHAENRAYDVFPSPTEGRSSFASPWYGPPYSIDLPSRMGVDDLVEVTAGQSAAWVEAGGVEVGVAASNQHWGPGRHGGLVIGPDAPGIPRFFVRMPHRIATPAGAWSASAFSGILTESRFFDRDSSNDYRSLSAVNVGWSPSPTSPLQLGIAHASMRSGTTFGPGPSTNGKSEQLNSVFLELGRNGSRAYVEVARAGALPSMRRFLTVPYGGIAYVVGLEHAVRRSAGTLVAAAEAANLEQPTDVRGEPSFDFYTSRAIPQGWSQRGRPLGYPTGPGSNHAALQLDWIAPQWSLGIFGDRTRWNEDAFLRQYLPSSPRHDVSFRAGIGAGYVAAGYEITAVLSTGKRLNYLFQNKQFNPEYRTVDVSIPQLRISLSPVPVRDR